MTLRSLTAVALLIGAAAGSVRAAGKERPMSLTVRTQVEKPAGSGEWASAEAPRQLRPEQTAIVICDMWDHHWCRSAERRCGEIARRMEPVLQAARKRGVFIIHAPSDTMEFYAGTLQRRRMQEFTRAEPPAPHALEEPPLPVDAADGGCDDLPQCETRKAWSRETPLLTVAPEDGITDRGEEVYNALRARGLTTVLVMGVHTNMCILNRTFALRQMTRWGLPCILVRDLTDTMYNPRQKPFVPHEEGTELVIRHIECYVAPSTTSKELLAWLSGR